MARKKRATETRIDYVEIGFSNGFRWRIDPLAQQAAEYESIGSLERCNGFVSLDDLCRILGQERAARAGEEEAK